MAAVITVAQQKGGAGKTTLAANLAAALAATHRVAVLDIDPQRTLARWHALRVARTPAVTPLGFSDVSGWRLQPELDRLRREHDVVLIDSAPHVDTDARRAIRSADLVLVPIQPSAPDVWAAEGTLKLVAEEKRRSCLVLNRVSGGTRARGVLDQELASRELAVLPTAIGNRTAFSLAFAQGLGVTELAPRTIAAAELRGLAQALMALVAS